MDYLVERAGAADREALLDLLYRTFRHKNEKHPRFEFLYPDLFPATDEAMGRHFIVREGGVPVACVGLYPIPFQVGPCRVRTFGLGQVATDPDRQGRGLMHAIMTRVRAELDAGGASLAWLGGRHERYSKYGWETAGTGWRMSFDGKSLGTAPAGWEVWKSAGGDGDFRLAWSVREQSPVRGLCPAEEYRLRMGRSGSETWLARKGDRSACVIFNPGWRSVMEKGGDPEGLLAVLGRLAESGGIGMGILPEADPHFHALLDRCVGAGGSGSMLSALDLRALAEDYAPLLRQRMPDGEALTLTVVEGGRPVSAVRIAGRGAQGAGLAIALPRRRMTAFLFGPARASFSAGLDGRDRWVDQVFPLPFITSPLFDV